MYYVYFIYLILDAVATYCRCDIYILHELYMGSSIALQNAMRIVTKALQGDGGS